MKTLIAAILIAATSVSAFASDTRFGTVRDGGAYEADARNAGLPFDGGMAWTQNTTQKPMQKVSPKELLRGGGQYERQLVSAGIPISNGLAWAQK